ncbi:MAG: FAD-dependent oxidoreductase [Candidatus Bathyarchaeota archaeon]|nr:FAD-dependent oxidoreductase [Candidatus Bathyarchaeota archaeon]
MDFIVEPQKRIPVIDQADVIVVGGGSAGVPAAIAAARNGADVMIIERGNCLGGTMTGGLMTRMDTSHAYWGKIPHEKRVARGLYLEILHKCRELGGVIEEYRLKEYLGGMLSGVEVFDPQILKFVLQEIVQQANVRLLYHTMAVDTIAEEQKVQAIIIENKSGRQAVEGQIFIDSTGDGDIATQAGAHYEKGRVQDGLLQPVTTTFRVGGVNLDKVFQIYGKKQQIMRDRISVSDRPFQEEVKAAKEDGVYDFPAGRFWFHLTPINDQIYVNTVRVHGIDATCTKDLTRAEVEGLKQVIQLMNFMRRYMKGFEQAHLVDIGSYIGVRESRRILGEYVLTKEDVLGATKFPDAIAACSIRIDIHNPTGIGGLFLAPPDGDYYQIPYRCVLAKHLANVLITGRCISASHEAHGSVRQVPAAIPIAEGAGTAAAMAIHENTGLRKIDIKSLQKRLISQGAFIG